MRRRLSRGQCAPGSAAASSSAIISANYCWHKQSRRSFCRWENVLARRRVRDVRVQRSRVRVLVLWRRFDTQNPLWLGNPRRDACVTSEAFRCVEDARRAAGLLAGACLVTNVGGAHGRWSAINGCRPVSGSDRRAVRFPTRHVRSTWRSPATASWVVVKDNRGWRFIDAEPMPNHCSDCCFPREAGRCTACYWMTRRARVWATTAQSTLYEAQRDGQDHWHWRRAIHLPGPSGRRSIARLRHGVGFRRNGACTYVCRATILWASWTWSPGQLLRQIPVGVAPYDVLLLPGEPACRGQQLGRSPSRTGRADFAVERDSGVGRRSRRRGERHGREVDLVRDRQMRETATGLHPADLIWDARRQQVLVANANSDTVTVLDGTDLSPLATLSVRPDADLPFGSASNALAMSADGTKTVRGERRQQCGRRADEHK